MLSVEIVYRLKKDNIKAIDARLPSADYFYVENTKYKGEGP